MEPIGKYKADRNGSAKAAAWRNMVDQDLDDVAFLADTDKAREARELRDAPVAVCSQRRALCLTVVFFSAMFATALIVVYATPQPDCPCAGESTLIPGQPPTDSEANVAAANKERIASNGAVFPWRGARLPTFIIPKHYSLWLHPNLTTGELRVLNVRDMNVTERALFKSGGSLGPKVAKTLDYPQADQTYIEFKEKLRRKYNYTLSLRFITKLERNDKQRGFFLTGTHRHRCAVSRFWLTHARSAFPCLDEPHFRATFKMTIVRDRFHVSLTNMPIVATEEAGFYLGHRLLQDEFAVTPPMPPHMTSVAVCRLQRRAAPTTTEPSPTPTPTMPTATEIPMEDEDIPPEISLYSDQQVILDESGPLLEWVQKTLQHFSYELNTSYPLPKFDIVVVEGGNPYSEGWGLITLSPSILSDTKTIARLLAQQWFGGTVSPRWWSSQWLLEALTSVLAEKAPAPPHSDPQGPADALLLDHVLPALRLDSSNSVRAVASPRLERADIEGATDELSLHKGAAIVSMAIEAAGEAAGRAALARLLRDHRFASADARDLWRALERDGSEDGLGGAAWDGWCERPGYPLLCATATGDDVVLKQERFVMSAEPPEPDPPMVNYLLTLELRADLDELFYEPENFTEISEDDVNATTTTTPVPTTTKRVVTTRAPPHKWVIPVTFVVGPVEEDENYTVWRNLSHAMHNSTLYDVGNETTPKARVSRWAENVTHLIWMNDTEMVIPDLGKHKWVRYNVGARGLYRVAPQDRTDGETLESAAQLYESGAAAERALLLDDAFVLSRAGRLPASRAVAAAARLSTETHWAPWRVVLNHFSWWRELLRLSSSGPHLSDMLKALHPAKVQVYTVEQLQAAGLGEDQLWLSGALLTAGVEWENPTVTKQAEDLFNAWQEHNQTIPEIYQEAAFTAGVRALGPPAWRWCWRALHASYRAPRPLYSHRALLAALASPRDDWLFYRSVVVYMSPSHIPGSLHSRGPRARPPRVAVVLARATRLVPRAAPAAAFTAGVRALGPPAWRWCWRALHASYRAPRPLYSHRALLAALASPRDDWLFYRSVVVYMSPSHIPGSLHSRGPRARPPRVAVVLARATRLVPRAAPAAAFTAGVRALGPPAWRWCWRALHASYRAPRPLYSHRALLAALASPRDDWLFYSRGPRARPPPAWRWCWRALHASYRAPRPLYSHRALLAALASPRDDWLFYRQPSQPGSRSAPPRGGGAGARYTPVPRAAPAVLAPRAARRTSLAQRRLAVLQVSGCIYVTFPYPRQPSQPGSARSAPPAWRWCWRALHASYRAPRPLYSHRALLAALASPRDDWLFYRSVVVYMSPSHIPGSLHSRGPRARPPRVAVVLARATRLRTARRARCTRTALLAALASPRDDWLFYRSVVVYMSPSHIPAAFTAGVRASAPRVVVLARATRLVPRAAPAVLAPRAARRTSLAQRRLAVLQAAFTAGVRALGPPAWRWCWRALHASYRAPRPLYSHRALLAALASPRDDWLFYRFAFSVLSTEAQRSREWRLWITTLYAATCRRRSRRPHCKPRRGVCISPMITIGLRSYSVNTAAWQLHWTL
ncbi:unnamed protein product [Chrysodeixis includens]|uniref:Uncharacterized protein n=1 Tax=Chrysodeixis includens TaxID=689277 RepID=A0A9P0C0A5_CHRIL|nr:unnamed protein product [Chrysodeixis includens]